jgi:hypothetical protein
MMALYAPFALMSTRA